MRKNRYWLFLITSLVLSALLPSALFLWVSYTSLTRSLHEQMMANVIAAVARSESVLSSVHRTLDGIAEQTHGACDDAARVLMNQAVYNNINIREIGVVANTKLVCNNEQVFTPAIQIVTPAHLTNPAAGTVYISGPEETVKSRSILIHRRIDDTSFVNALVYPEVFGDTLEHFRIGQASGVYLLDAANNPLIALGRATISEIPNATGNDPHIITVGRTHYAIAKSSRYPVSAVVTATRPWFVERWWRDALFALSLGLLVSGLIWTIIRRYLPNIDAIDDDLVHALESGHFQVHYQPIVALERPARVVAHEALIRWIDGNGPVMSPDEFIARAEHTGFIRQITRLVLAAALADRAQLGGAYVSINLSTADLEDPSFAETTVASAADLRGIVFEITERELITDDLGIVRRNLEQLIAAGARIALDDFGSGYCGLNYLRQFPLHIIKMDQSFTRSIGTDAVGAVLAERIVEVGRSLGLEVIAEGIESERVADQIRAIGIGFGQGWHFGKAQPLPMRETKSPS